ncbi:MAG TPA: acyl-CoA dehydrogenase family protein [Acidimicrobiales bacterium]|nr:acyl-CoA dehydrogenase family protein [Acidimicrobiales bacterium]
MTDASETASVRREVEAWLDQWWEPDRPLVEWRGLLADSGWGCPAWPADCYGRGLSPELAAVVAEAFALAGAVGPAAGAGMALAAPTILAHGSAELRARLLRPIVTGEDKWCQLFSEPGSGSDLAGLTTRADRDGDEWVVNGQKVWTTGAHQAAYGMLLARTDWDAPKHRGITYFALPMRQGGVEVRPLRQMNGRASFNEVFLTDARVPHSNMVGEAGGGWAVALTTLAHERGLPTARLAAVPAGGRGRTAIEAAAEAAEYAKTYEWYPQRAGRPDLVPSQARATGRAGDAVVRQKVARVVSLERVARWSVERSRAGRAAGRPPGPEGSIAKLCASEIARSASDAHAHLAGADAMVSGSGSALEGIVAEIIVSVPAGSIAGGTDEIQHNIVGERVLGLPKEPQVDAEVPFREVRTNTPRR